MRKLLLILAILSSFSAEAQLLIRNVTIVDVENKKLLPPQDVQVTNGTISAIGTKLSATNATQVIDGTGKWLMPGLVDAHVHFFQSGSIYTRPDAINLARYQPYAKEIDWSHQHMEDFLRRYAAAGITSVIDVGATANFLRQRDTFRTKDYSPGVYMTGPLLTTWEPEVFKPLGDDEPFYLMKTVNDAKAYVQKQLPLKPDFIKIWYIVNGRNVDSAARASLPLVKAVIDESHKQGLRVAVHATELITAKLSVEAGADYLVHSVDEPIDEAFIQLLKNNKTVLSPTLVVVGNYPRALGQMYTPTKEDMHYAHPAPVNTMFDMAVLSDTLLTNRIKRAVQNGKANMKREDSIRMSNLARLMAAGVLIATGTDAGNIGTHHVSSYFDELRYMQQAGMSTWKLLEASTINGAKAIGRQQQFGTIAKGLQADMLLLSKDPTLSIDNWKNIEWVVNKGVAFRPDSLRRFTPTDLADQQLLAYNAHDLEAFLQPYADSVEIYNLNTGKLEVKGKEAMRTRYNFLSTVKVLHCKLLNRIVQGNIVIDHEEITAAKGKFYGVAIYEVANNKIVRVWFPD